MLLLLMLTSKGMAGRAARLAGGDRRDALDLQHAGGGLLLIMGVDQFLDMGRSATNVVGNSVAAAVVAQVGGQCCVPSSRASIRAQRSNIRFRRRYRRSEDDRHDPQPSGEGRLVRSAMAKR